MSTVAPASNLAQGLDDLDAPDINTDPATAYRAKLVADPVMRAKAAAAAVQMGGLPDAIREEHQDMAAGLADSLVLVEHDGRMTAARAILGTLPKDASGELLDIYRHALTQPREDCADDVDDCPPASILTGADWDTVHGELIAARRDVRRKAKAAAQDAELSLADMTEVVFTSRVVAEELAGGFAFTSAFGWMHYTGTHWTRVGDHVVAEQVRRFVMGTAGQQIEMGPTGDRLKAVMSMMRGSFVSNVTRMSQGALAVSDDVFDSHPDMLNVLNGVVNLRTGELTPHRPDLYFTKVAPTAYRAGATSAVLVDVLTAVDDKVRDWMQLRAGNAITGEAPDDDRVAFMNGAGGNGKSIWLKGASATLGTGTSGYLTMANDDLLLSDHVDREARMSLRGARFVIIEELPEGKRLNVTMLKKLAGTDAITARHNYARGEITFKLAATIFITANYDPQVAETDTGTWRRIAKVPFPYSYVDTPTTDKQRKRDPRLPKKLRDAEFREAMLAWMVQGAVRWYKEGLMIDATPADVVAATNAWRADSDSVLSFFDEFLVPSRGHYIASMDMLRAFNEELRAANQGEWSGKLIAGRFGTHSRLADHGVKLVQGFRTDGNHGLTASRKGNAYEPLKKQIVVWSGVRFRTDADDTDGVAGVDDTDGADEQQLTAPAEPGDDPWTGFHNA